MCCAIIFKSLTSPKCERMLRTVKDLSLISITEMHGLNLLPKQNPDMQREKMKKKLQHVKWTQSYFYRHIFPESVLFPQFPGSELDILMIGSCKSLQKKEKQIYSKLLMSTEVLICGEKNDALIHLCDLWLKMLSCFSHYFHSAARHVGATF